MIKSLFKRIKTKDGFSDFKHHASSWRNSKKLRQRNRRRKINDINVLSEKEEDNTPW